MKPSDPAAPLPSSHPRRWPLWLAGIAVGAAGWWIATIVSGRREAWDAPEYGSIAYPTFALATLALGYAGRSGSWRWPIAIAIGQCAAAFTIAGEVPNLWPFSLVAFAVYSAPLLLTAWAGQRVRRWREE